MFLFTETSAYLKNSRAFPPALQWIPRWPAQTWLGTSPPRKKKQTSPPWGPDSKSNSRGWGRQKRSNAPHMPGVPPPLGLNIDRCIRKHKIMLNINVSKLNVKIPLPLTCTGEMLATKRIKQRYDALYIVFRTKLSLETLQLGERNDS